MKKATLLFFTAITLLGCNHPKSQTAKGALLDLQANLRKHKSISYRVKLRVKSFGSNDTIVYDGPCILIKDSRDTLFNGYVWYYSKWGNYLYYRYFDLDSIDVVDDSLQKITSYNKPVSQYWAITGNTSSYMINTFFLDTMPLTNILKDSSISKIFSRDKIGNEIYWKVSVKYPDDAELKDKRTDIWINPQDSTLKKVVRRRQFQNRESFVEWDIDSTVFDKETPAGLKALMKHKFATYKVERYVPHEEKSLRNGVKAPEFSGIQFGSGKKVSLSGYKGKIILLDFWYMDCIWCVRAMPMIEKTRDEFASKGLVVLGMNSFDTSMEQQKKLPDFIKINKNTYPTILTTRSTDKEYSVYGYPTLYIIDKKGNIAYSDVGYRKDLDSVLAVEINKLLK